MAKIDIDAFAARAWQAVADALRAEAATLSFDEKEHATVCMLSAKKAEANAARHRPENRPTLII